jgi:molybdate/tungstate transport system permease protein
MNNFLFFFIFILLAVLHLLFFRSFLDPGTNAIVFCANAFFALSGIDIYRKSSFYKFVFYLFGYLLLFIFVFLLGKSPLLFTLFIILFSAFFLNTYLLVYLIIFILAIIFVTPYWLQTFLVFSLYYFFCHRIYKKTFSGFLVAMFTIGFIFVFLITFPILYFALQITPQTLLVTAKNLDFQRALLNSFLTSIISTLIVLILGVPFAYVMARCDFTGKKILDNLIDLPIVIPQTVAGVALLVLLGPKSPLGEFMFKNCRLAIANGYLGIIAAQIFVSSPFLIRSAINAFESIDQKLEDASRTLGSSPLNTFWRISLPLAGSGIFNGCILSWARSLSEVGSLMVIAYYPMTASVFIYDEFIKYGLSETQPIAILLVLTCLWAFITLRWLRYQLIKR